MSSGNVRREDSQTQVSEHNCSRNLEYTAGHRDVYYVY
mgnify:CR=1 FL=1